MHPVLYEISLGSSGAYRVSAFGALFGVGLALALWLTLRRGARSGLGAEPLASAALAAVLAGILGARLGFVLLHPSDVASLGAALSLRSGGLSGPAGVAIGAGVLGWVGRRRGLSLPALFDAAAPGLGVALFVTRFGCWLEGCDFGRPLSATAPAWLARLGTFPSESPAWVAQVLAGSIAPSAGASAPVHPTELYEGACGALLVALALGLARRQRAAGTTALGVLAGYLVLRVLVDLSRVPSSDVWLGRALALLGLGGAAFFARRELGRPASASGP